MKSSFVVKCTLAAAAIAMLFQAGASAQDNSPYVVSTDGYSVHILPTPSEAQRIQSGRDLQTPGVLSYHGGPIMPSVSIYTIYWKPATLQNGSSTGYSALYQSVINNFANDYTGHGIANNSTQYYQIIGGVTTYIKTTGGSAGSYLDTNPYPASGCTDSVTSRNCITDAQLQAEVQRVMTLKGWTGGLKKIFLVFTSSGEGSCTNGSSTSCAYTQYCAYHGNFVNGSGAEVIYGNEPYADPTYCAAGGQTFPSGDHFADAAVNVASHEVTEANTDPELNAWWDSGNGEEIGDLCAWTFGTNTWDSSLANQMWNGRFYELQREYDNHTSSCVQVGP